MPRLRLDLAYMGAKYAGWQIQTRKDVQPRPETRTVQGVLELTAANILGQHVRVHGASRTDAGVHALGQVAHLDIPEDKTSIDWQLALNNHLPNDVTITAATFVPDNFHARFDAQSKIYTYRLWQTRRYVLPQVRPFVWSLQPLNLDAMLQAAAHFVGEHDFASFKNQGCHYRSTVRTLYSITHHTSPDSPELTFTFHGQGFLKQMVRNIMGCLVAVGQNKLSPADIPPLLAALDRTAAPPTAPACGLTLVKILYEEEKE